MKTLKKARGDISRKKKKERKEIYFPKGQPSAAVTEQIRGLKGTVIVA